MANRLSDEPNAAEMPVGSPVGSELGTEGGPAPQVTIVVCSSCRFAGDPEADPRPGLLLARATAGAAADTAIRVRRVGCLGNCSRGLSAAVLREGSWSYVFGGLDTNSAADLVAGAELFRRTTDGFMPYGARPEALKRGLIARIPTLESLKDIP